MDVVAPGTHGTEVVTTHSGYGRHGLEGKDSVLIEGLNNGNLHREATRDVLASSKDNQLAVLENRVQAAMLSKDMERQLAQQALENRVALIETKYELAAGVIADGEKTRDLIRTNRDVDQAVALVDAKNEILALKTKLGVTP
jgi:hypothetical protein